MSADDSLDAKDAVAGSGRPSARFLRMDEEEDVCYLTLTSACIADTVAVGEEVLADLDSDRSLVGVEFRVPAGGVTVRMVQQVLRVFPDAAPDVAELMRCYLLTGIADPGPRLRLVDDTDAG